MINFPAKNLHIKNNIYRSDVLVANKTNFTVNGKNYYRITKTIGKRADGSPIRKTFYGSGVKETTQKVEQYMNSLKMGLINNCLNGFFL